MAERTNEQWIAELQPDSPVRTAAIEDLRVRLERGLLYYLSHERSDLTDHKALAELKDWNQS